MKKTLGFLVSMAALAAVVWGCQCVSERSMVEEAPPPPEPQPAAPAETNAAEAVSEKALEPPLPPPPAHTRLKPRKYDGSIGHRLGDMLPKSHVSQRRFDDEISRRAWTNLVSFYDFDHSLFLKSDLDELSKRQSRLDDEIKSGDVTFGYDVYNLYVERLRERVDFATNLAANADFDFSVNETFRARRKDAPWPETREAAEEHWRKRIKNEFLIAKINHDLDKSTNALETAKDVVKRYRQLLFD